MIKNSKFNQNSKFKIQNFRLKSFPKILTIFFLTVFVLQIICLFFLLAAPVASQAIEFKPQVGIPGSEFEKGYTFKKDDSTAPIAKYVKAIYNYAIGIVGILAAVVLMVGGVLWIVAGGNATQIGEAKAWIGAALTGLVLALTSYLILSTVNPALVNLQITKIPGVKEAPVSAGMGCCKELNFKANTVFYADTTIDNCKKSGDITVIWDPGVKCPTSCCLSGYKPDREGFGGTWLSCIYKSNLTQDHCERSLRGVYTEIGKCATASRGGYKCISN